MSEPPRSNYRRDDIERRTRDDVDRLARRGGDRAFWRSVALVGSVGWPIVLLALGGAFLGRWLDGVWGTGIGVTLTLLVVGIVAGTWIAFRTLREDRP